MSRKTALFFFFFYLNLLLSHKFRLLKFQFQRLYLVDVVQFGTRPATIVRFLAEPFGAYFDSAPTGLAAARPVGPFTEFTV